MNYSKAHTKLILFIYLSILSTFLPSSCNEGSIFRGYITNKIYQPMKLKIYEIDQDSLYTAEKNLDDNSYVPFLNLKITTDNISDYSVSSSENDIFIPEATMLVGYISEIEPPKHFNKKGFYKVSFDKAICPDGEIIYLKSNLTSQSIINSYNPLHHIGKTTLSVIGGSLAGTFLSYGFGGLGLTVATHGYSLAAGAAVGGFIGAISGLAAKGKTASIELGDELNLIPVDEASLQQLKQITCKKAEPLPEQKLTEQPQEEIINNNNVVVEIISVKKSREFSGDTLIKIKIKITNDTKETLRTSNFFLKDSQGKEYTTSILDLDNDIFTDFIPKECKTVILGFVVEHPKADYWLILKDRNFNKEIGGWKI